jgi:hemolysin-activating ACP:hemolysin acyltransferase
MYGNILVYLENGRVVGYVELWFLNDFQLANVLEDRFEAIGENLNNGKNCYVADIWIDKEFNIVVIPIKNLA